MSQAKDTNIDYPAETSQGQTLLDGRWINEIRGTAFRLRQWQEDDPSDRRVVHFLDGTLLIPAECGAYNAKRQGVCRRPLTLHDDCPDAADHEDA